jgi:acetyltransferase-like isoleucine patch superfamily enzyme
VRAGDIVMRLGYKVALRSYQRAARLVQSFFGRALLWCNRVEWHSSVRLRGWVYLENHGTLRIGPRVTISSGPAANPVGSCQRTTIIVARDGFVDIGEDTGLSNTEIYCWQRIVIGRRVLVGGGCKIYDSDFHPLDPGKRIPDERAAIVNRPVIIGNDVFLGGGTLILKGVTIGDRSIVGAGSVVSRDVPPDEIWAGNPASFIRRRPGA